MCGLAGIFAFADAAAPVDRQALLTMRDHMSARGPDAAGDWIDEAGRIGLAHRRLSIIDLSERAHQPMLSPDGQTVISYNGEIYNFRELAETLIATGHVFRTRSDTEVLLAAYAEYGPDMVHHLRGMFAFAIWDSAQQRLFLARDPYGIKPLYYATDGRTIAFASQAKALIAAGLAPRDEDPAGWVGFYLFGAVPEPFTTWRGITVLEAGSTLIVERRGKTKTQKYFRVGDIYTTHAAPPPVEADADALYRAALLDTVRKHMVADVPVGCFLSAGVDSCSLLALMAEVSDTRLQAVTLGFEEFAGTQNDETVLAGIVARKYGADHHIEYVRRQDFEAELDHILAAMDQPTLDGINSWFVSKAARNCDLKVVVSGLGGDELFGGYPIFQTLPKWSPWITALARIPGLGLASRVAITQAQRLKPFGNPKLGGVLEYGKDLAAQYLVHRGLFMPWELPDMLDGSYVREGLERLNVLERIAEQAPDGAATSAGLSALEAAFYMRHTLLRDSDWASMAHSLELRTPLVDTELLRSVATIKDRPGKQFLSRAVRPALPEEVFNRPKTGFATPTNTWIAQMAEGRSERTAAIDTPLTALGSRGWALRLADMWKAAS